MARAKGVPANLVAKSLEQGKAGPVFGWLLIVKMFHHCYIKASSLSLILDAQELGCPRLSKVFHAAVVGSGSWC